MTVRSTNSLPTATSFAPTRLLANTTSQSLSIQGTFFDVNLGDRVRLIDTSVSSNCTAASSGLMLTTVSVVNFQTQLNLLMNFTLPANTTWAMCIKFTNATHYVNIGSSQLTC